MLFGLLKIIVKTIFVWQNNLYLNNIFFVFVIYIHLSVYRPEPIVRGEENCKRTVVAELVVVDVLDQLDGPGHFGLKVRVAVVYVFQYLCFYENSNT